MSSLRAWTGVYMPQYRLLNGIVLASLVLALVALAAPMPGQAQSFSCASAGTSTEHAICANKFLGNLDLEMVAQYQRLRSVMNATQRAGLQEDQRRWLRQRNRCGGAYGCLEVEYSNRISALIEWRADLY
ncbi:MAG: lysozyme inhibitor LprI family protein [Pseudomonadota bacterium]